MSSEPMKPIVLPKKGTAKVKSVLSGDTVVLLGRPLQPNQPAPEVVFTLESLNSPVSLIERRMILLTNL